jgi:hypothetical protein
MNTLKWVLISLLVGLGVGFGLGIWKQGGHEAAKTMAAELQKNALEAQVKTELKLRVAQSQAATDARKKANDSDAHAMKLLAQLNRRPKPLAPIPTTGPAFVPAPNPIFPIADPLKDDVIAALTRDVADQKTLVLKLTTQIATDGVIIANYQKQDALNKIALDAQIAANRSAGWKGGIKGAGLTIGIEGVLALGHHFLH